MSLFAELKRRNVFRVALAYAVVAWLLMQIGDTLAPALLLPDWSTRFLAFVLILGFPLALFFAWAFELTPDGIKREKSVPRDESIAPATGRKLDILIIALLAVAVGYLAWDKFAVRDNDDPAESVTSTATLTPGRRAIAVLPFVNLSNNAEQEYFSDGLSEELLNLLSKIPQLRVISRSSAFSFKGKDYTIADVGEKLGVSYVLEGSVRRSGEQIRVSAQLIDASSDENLWSDTWDRAFRDVFAIQDEIAEAVTTALRIQLVDELPHVFVTDPRAYELYLKARALVGEQTEASVLEAEELLQEVLEIDPEYAPGLVLFGESEAFLGGWDFLPKTEAFDRARVYGQRATEAAPTYGAGYALLSRLAIRRDRDLGLSKRLIEEAIRLDPSDISARLQAARLDALQGNHDEHVRLAREMVRLDPLSGRSYWRLGHALNGAGYHDEAVTAFRKLLELSPDAAAGHAALAYSLLLSGRFEEALAEFNAEPMKGFTYYGLAMTYYKLGQNDRSDAAMQAMLELDDADEWAAQIAEAHAARNEIDDAMRWLNRGLELDDQGISVAAFSPFFENLRGDPRFEDFLVRLWSGKD